MKKPNYGRIEHTTDGLPICHICGKAFKRVIAHARQKHDVTAFEYKELFGLDNKKGVCSKESSAVSRKAVKRNANKCIFKNLIKGGEKTRYKKGSKGRTKDQVREQTRVMLATHARTNITTEQRAELMKQNRRNRR